MSDEELINLITNNHTLKYVSNRYLNKIKKQNYEGYLEILNRYDEYDSVKEILFRLLNNIEIRPVCAYCGGRIKFINIKGNRHWQEYCSQECLHNDEKHWDKCRETSIKKYGSPNYRNIKKAKETSNKKYNCDNYTQTEEYKKRSNISKQISQLLNNSIVINISDPYKYENEAIESRNNTLNKYGSLVNIKKRIKTNLEKYGVEHAFQSSIIKDKIKKIVQNKYGVDCVLQLDYIRAKNTSWSKESREKSVKTSIEHFGKENYNNRKKVQETCLKRYGVTNKRKLKESREHMSKVMSSKEIQEKRNNTLKQNKTFNTSIPEQKSYELLKEKFPDIKYQYRSEQYPFTCDFYIPSLDLYIECNYHWTHGGKPFENSEDDQKLLSYWQSKNTKYYDNAIKTWTIRDKQKIIVANRNNLNYILFYNINELKTWLKNELYN